MARARKSKASDHEFLLLACVAVIVLSMAIVLNVFSRPSTVEVSYARQQVPAYTR